MKLIAYRVTNYRSVKDSGWIEVDDVTSLIGTNESGKTNLLLPLWKLNPARGGDIELTSDSPRNKYSEIRASDDKPTFITAKFMLDEKLVAKISEITDVDSDEIRIAEVSRRLDGRLVFNFPDEKKQACVLGPSVAHWYGDAKKLLEDYTAPSEDLVRLKDQLYTEVASIIDSANETESFTEIEFTALTKALDQIDTSGAENDETLTNIGKQLAESKTMCSQKINRRWASGNTSVEKLVTESLPRFVYYSNYGNLDSEIYLPHVIENLERDDLGAKEEARARTLRVLFSFVQLEPKEIFELGEEAQSAEQKSHLGHATAIEPTEEEIKAAAERKRQRDILLQSAGTSLTTKFKDWWRQGTYRFRFAADGNHFRIWVSDDQRPEEIELELRSTGLQWFLSFYLVFLVESKQEHSNTILLLDEPGLSLHPLAQNDLSNFFDSLGITNQIVYTTHSPFMIDANRLERVRAVYIGDDGTSQVSTDLRAGEKNSAQTKSVYPVHSALGLSTSATLLEGCQPIIVEGPSDQYYLSAMRSYLVAHGDIQPKREMLFMPSGGVRAVKMLVSIVAGKQDALPMVLLDADEPGKQFSQNLKNSLYAGDSAARVLLVSEFISNIECAEIEDLMPGQYLANIVTKMLRGPDDDFSDVYVAGQPFVGQVEDYATRNEITLALGWKVELARQAKIKMIKFPDRFELSKDAHKCWVALFERLSPT